jgi:hypothetical protein
MSDSICNAAHCDNELVGGNILGWKAKGGYCDSCWLLG